MQACGVRRHVKRGQPATTVLANWPQLNEWHGNSKSRSLILKCAIVVDGHKDGQKRLQKHFLICAKITQILKEVPPPWGINQDLNIARKMTSIKQANKSMKRIWKMLAAYTSGKMPYTNHCTKRVPQFQGIFAHKITGIALRKKISPPGRISLHTDQ